MPLATAKEFFSVLAHSRLLAREQVQAAKERAQRSGQRDPLKLAQELVDRRLLTVWQAERLLEGKTTFFLGSYKFLEPIGEGGMGVVFKAEHAVMGRCVAVKVLSKAKLTHPNSLARFRREVKALASLNHPNIVTAHDAGQSQGTHFLVMEFIDGIDLAAWLERYQRLPIPWACEFVRQAALGLEHAHALGMVHRDIKPANILVSWRESEGRWLVKILDLGLARALDDAPDEPVPAAVTLGAAPDETLAAHLTRAGTIVGTPDYLAPEQIMQGQVVDARSDVFSLGCTLFRLLTNQLPYDGPDLMSKIAARVAPTAPPPLRLRSVLPEADPKLERVLGKMLEREPRNRFVSAAEAAAALEPFCQGAAPLPPALNAARRAPDDSREVGSSQMDFDPRLRDFLDHLRETGSPYDELERETASQRGVETVEPEAIAAPRGERSPMRAHAPPIIVAGRRRGRRQWLAALGVASACAALAGGVGYSRWRAHQEAARWPMADAGLVLGWRRGLGSERLLGREGERPEFRLELRGDADFDDLGTLYFNSGLCAIRGAAAAVLEACQASHELSLELAFSSGSGRQRGPARLLTFSSGDGQANFVLGQQDDRIVFWARTSGAGTRPDRLEERELCRIYPARRYHLLLACGDGRWACWLDGRPIFEGEAPAGNFSNWTAQQLVLGAEINRTFPWQGRIDGLAIFDHALSGSSAVRRHAAAEAALGR